MPNKTYLITMPKGWSMNDPCRKCLFENDGCYFPSTKCTFTDLHAREAIEVHGGLSRAIATQFDKEVKLFAVETGDQK